MSRFLRWLMVSLVMVVLSGCGGGSSGDGTPDTSGGDDNVTNLTSVEVAKLISVSSASKDSAYVEWLPSSSEQNMTVTYEVHFSTQTNFTATDATRKVKTTDKEILVTGLDASKEYFVMVVATNTNGDTASSMQLSVKTSSISAELIAGQTVVVHESSEIVAQSEVSVTTSKQMKVGEYIVGDSSNIYLRKVISVEKNGTNYTAQTEPAAVGEVFSDLEFSTSFKMEELDETPQVASNISKTSAGTIQTKRYQWKSGSQISSEYLGVNKLSTGISPLGKVVISKDMKEESGNYYSFKSPSIFSVNVGDTLKHSLDITHLNSDTYSYNDYLVNEVAECEGMGGTYDYKGQNECIDIPVKLCSATYSAKDLNNLGSNNLPRVTRTGDNFYIEWTPSSNNVDKTEGGEYLLDITLNIGVGDCTDDNKDFIETVKIHDIKLVAGEDLPSKLLFAKESLYTFENIDSTIIFENKLSAEFSPELIFDGRFIDSDLKEGNAKLKTTFTLSDIAKLHMELSADKTFTPKPIFTKKFTKIIMAGYVPIVVTGQMKFMAVAELSSNASIDATLDTGMTLEMDYGLHYDGTEWSAVSDKNFTYHIKAEAEGSAEATMTVRLIPDLSIEIYELAAAHLLAEPYLYATIGVEGKLTAQVSNSDNSYTDANAHFTKLEAGTGIDLRVYAGAAWKTKWKSLKYPSDATYATISGMYFMNSKMSKYLDEYYENTRTYEKFEVMGQTPIAGIPTLTQDPINYQAIPSESINSRAIKVTVGYENISNPLYTLGLGKESYIYFQKWDGAESVTQNASVLSTGTEGEYWVIPKLELDGSQYNTEVRFIAHSNLGVWARQTLDVTLEVSSDADSIPSYWAGRYVETGEVLKATDDTDNDGYSNLQEYQNGTNPTVKDGVDAIPPVITIAGDNPSFVILGESYSDAGASAEDDREGDVTVTILTNNVDTSHEGNYSVVYNASDSVGNEVNVTRYVTVAEEVIVPPVDEPNTTTNLTNGLVAHYEFEGNANDSSGNGNHGEEFGGVSYVDGVIGKAGSFDGLDDYIQVLNDTSLELDRNLTLSFWILAEEQSTVMPVVCKNKHTFNNYTVWASGILSGITFQQYNASLDPKYDFHTEYNLAENKFVHIVTVRNFDSVKIYANNNLLSVDSANYDAYLKKESLYIGYDGGYGYDKYKGKIDDLRIYNRALNDAEIQELYEKGSQNSNTIFSYHDEFNDINKSFWNVVRVDGNWKSNVLDYNAVTFENGVIDLYNDRTDDGPVMYSNPIEINKGDIITVKRRAYVHTSNRHLNASLTIMSTDSDTLDVNNAQNLCYISHVDETYQGDWNGFYLNGRSNDDAYIAPIWDDWFIEELKYNTQTGEATYTVNDTTVSYTCKALESEKNILFRIHNFGWYTGHYLKMDYIDINIKTEK